jgi:HlyD family secretion protein
MVLRIIKNIFCITDKKQKIIFFFIQTLIFFLSILEILSIFLLGGLIAFVSDKNINEKNTFLKKFLDYLNVNSIYSYTSILVTIVIITSVLSIFSNWYIILFAQKNGYQLSNNLYKNYLNKNWLFHTSNSSSKLINTIQHDAVRITEFLIVPLMHLNSKVVLLISMLFVVFYVNWLLTSLLVLIFAIFYILFYLFIRDFFEKNGKKVSDLNEERLKILSESFSGIREVILYKLQYIFVKKFYSTSRSICVGNSLHALLSALPKNILEILALIIFVGMAIFFKQYNNSFNDQLPTLVIYAVAAYKLIPAIQQITFYTSSIRAASYSFDKILDDLKNQLLIEKNEIKNKTIINKKKILLESNIELKNISFAYEKIKKNVLNDINFKIEKNSILGIVGANGSGKSTLLDILLGLIKPDRGQVIIDGVSLTEENNINWSDNIGYVPQNTFLFDSTVLENITLKDKNFDINYSKLNKILELSKLDEFIKNLPKGINSSVGEKGYFLSGGTKQKILIARSLYKNADIFIFDEATSALDLDSQNDVIDTILNLKNIGKTIIIVAHQINILRKCDKLILIDQGNVSGCGNFEELKNNNLIFKKIFSL